MTLVLSAFRGLLFFRISRCVCQGLGRAMRYGGVSCGGGRMRGRYLGQRIQKSSAHNSVDRTFCMDQMACKGFVSALSRLLIKKWPHKRTAKRKQGALKVGDRLSRWRAQQRIFAAGERAARQSQPFCKYQLTVSFTPCAKEYCGR